MIVGIGIDTIDIHRFNHWHTYSNKKLSRVFTQDELTYCMTIGTKTAERFAVRFAAKEAFYKAFSSAYPQHSIPFLSICKAANIYSSAIGKPELRVDWQLLHQKPFISHISLTHTPTSATALVILES